MTSPAHGLVLLDSNILVEYVRWNDFAKQIEQDHSLLQLDRPILSTIVEGEIKGLAGYKYGWGPQKMQRLDHLLSLLTRVDAGLPEVVEAYIELYGVARSEGQAIADPNQNDLWIAATVKATGATLYTCDKDFNFLHPDHINVCYIPHP